jgi:predicted MFS family arabinose efflux permease
MTEPVTSDVERGGRSAVLRIVVPGTAMIAVSFGLARYGYGLLLPEMRADLGLDAGTAGLIASGTYLSYLVANVAAVVVADRWGPRAAIGAAGLFAAAGMAIMAAADAAWILAVGVLLAGAASGLAYPPYAALVAQGVPERRRDVAWSAISSGTGWGVAVAGPLAIVAGDRWRAVWLVFIVLAVGVGAAAVLLAPRSLDTVRSGRPQLSWTWFICPRSRPLLISAVLVGTGSAVWWSFSVDALRTAGLAPGMANAVFAVCGVAGVLASVSGAVFGRVGLRRGYLAGGLLLAVSLGLLALTGAVALGAFAAAVLFGVCYNGVIAAHGIWSSRVFADHPAAGLAAVNTALTVGTLAGPTLAGVGVTLVGYPVTLGAAAAVLLLALPFCPPTARRAVALDAHRERCRAAPVRTWDIRNRS